MKQVLLQIGKHSSIYMISQIINNGLSVLMLPIYLRYFTPRDFGCITAIDLSLNLLFLTMIMGILAALNRYHFEARSAEEQRTTWWSGLLFLTVTTTTGVAIAWPLAGVFSQLRIGEDVSEAPLWIRLALVSRWLDIQVTVLTNYLRVKKRSGMIVVFTIVRSLVFVGSCITGIVFLQLGPTAMFVSNVIASGLLLAAQYPVILPEWGRPIMSRAMCVELWKYGWPMFSIGLLLALMNQLNRWFLNLEQIGLLSLGIQVAEKVNYLIVTPFQQIWSVLVYELHQEHPERAIRTYGLVFELFCYVMISVFFGCSVAAEPTLAILAKPEYLASVPLIPILCLAQFCFAVSDQFQAPIRIAKRTRLIIPAAAVGVVVAFLANWQLVRLFDVYGSAWATVATYATYSGVNLLIARLVEIHPYPFHRIGAVLAGVSATFVGYQAWQSQLESRWLSLGVGLGLWFLWTAAMAAVVYRRFHDAPDEPASSSPVAAELVGEPD
jgi:O-antigen/teichoic acid export membrane protein